MRFLERLLRILPGWFKPPAKDSASTRVEDPTVTVARYIFQSNQVRGGIVTHRAFMPPQDLRLSVFNIVELLSSAIWQLGEKVRSERQGQPTLIGRADLGVSAILSTGLQAEKDEPPQRHVVLVGWDPVDKAKRKAKAQVLAARAVFHPNGSST